MSQTQYNAINQTKLTQIKDLLALPDPVLRKFINQKEPWVQRLLIRALQR